MSDNEILRKAISTYGNTMQMIVCMEEMAELIKCLTKALRGEASVSDILEERVDVQIMLDQIDIIFGLDIDSRMSQRRHKIDRLEKRIDTAIDDKLDCIYEVENET